MENGPPHSQTKVCLYGAGRWGRNLARCFHKLGVLVAVVDPSKKCRRFITEEYGIPAFAIDSDMPEILASEINAVAIATPAATHTYLAMRSMDLGRDVFVEKPMALDLDDAKSLQAEALRRGRLLMIGHILLYHPAIKKLKYLIASGDLGDIRYVYSNRLNLGTVRTEENILWSFAPHDIAVILHLMDAEPSHVQATGGSWLQPGIKDVTVTHLDFPQGQKAHVFVSWLHPFKEQKLVVVGSQKMAVFDDLRQGAQLIVRDAGIDVDEAGLTSKRLGEEEVIALPQCEPLLEECLHFVTCCATRETPLTDGAHGVNVMRVLSLAEKNLAQDTQDPAGLARPPRREETGT
ncbi:MAG: UDP-2-acetamido-3-amino-2,3-dideoxy-glucuronate N-acetyltransferase [Planctomycetota bacterium]|jgi:UDP-2-acetamido-3-amino-2,3-dideoxy-glucuronate N-acetyltransferase